MHKNMLVASSKSDAMMLLIITTVFGSIYGPPALRMGWPGNRLPLVQWLNGSLLLLFEKIKTFYRHFLNTRVKTGRLGPAVPGFR